MLLQLLPERLLRGHPAILHQRPDGVPELVEGHRADGRIALRLLVPVDPVCDSLLVVRIECEELLDLVTEVAKYARSDEEVIATVAYMLNGGRARLCGNFKGARFDLDALTDDVAA